MLSRVAGTIRTLGRIHIHDITFHDELDEDGHSWPMMTVYYDLEPGTSRQASVPE